MHGVTAKATIPDLRQQVVDLMAGFTMETTPGSAAKVADFREHLRPGTDVYVTSLPGSDSAATLEVAKRLQREGLNPVPHIAARSIRDRASFDRQLGLLTAEAGVRHVLVIAGALRQPLGEFSDSLQLLESGLLDRHGIRKIGVAGHPEGSPEISEGQLRDALRWKNAFAERTDAELYVITQFCFEPDPIIEWDRRIQAEGNRLPIRIGVPGLASLKTLLGYAKACGIGPSMRFLSRQAMNVAKLMSVSAPDALVAALAEYKSRDPRCGISGVHVYPFGGLKKSADWAYAASDGRITPRPDRRGFVVEM